MKPLEIANGIYWVGALDWNIRDFHGYAIYKGTTYNAFLIVDEKITLVDTVKKDKLDQMFDRIAEIVDPAKIDYVISNHTELDHSGALPWAMERIGAGKPVYCSKLGHKNLSLHFGDKLNYQPVENGGSLNIGQRTLTFLETRMLHWPDSMFTYSPSDKVLFSSDAFGQHYCGCERFDDEMPEGELMTHAKKYYANILTPYSPLVLKLIEQVGKMNLDIRMILPDHGVMWRRNPGKVIAKYEELAKQQPTRKAVIVYDTMWHSTEKLAEHIADALIAEKVDVKLMRMRASHRSDIVTEVVDAGAVIVGSPTFNNGLFPTMADYLTYMKGLRFQNKAVAAFGSFGWSGECVKLLNKELEDMKLNIVHPGVKCQFLPDEKAVDQCRELAAKIAEALPK